MTPGQVYSESFERERDARMLRDVLEAHEKQKGFYYRGHLVSVVRLESYRERDIDKVQVWFKVER